MKDTKALVLETIRLAQRLYELDTEMLQTIRDTHAAGDYGRRTV